MGRRAKGARAACWLGQLTRSERGSASVSAESRLFRLYAGGMSGIPCEFNESSISAGEVVVGSRRRRRASGADGQRRIPPLTWVSAPRRPACGELVANGPRLKDHS